MRNICANYCALADFIDVPNSRPPDYPDENMDIVSKDMEALVSPVDHGSYVLLENVICPSNSFPISLPSNLKERLLHDLELGSNSEFLDKGASLTGHPSQSTSTSAPAAYSAYPSKQAMY
ncbi:hypothetical protein ACOME3_007763 [Neoechinorhynchus agilis]